jgi:hypothetical protein
MKGIFYFIFFSKQKAYSHFANTSAKRQYIDDFLRISIFHAQLCQGKNHNADILLIVEECLPKTDDSKWLLSPTVYRGER